MNDVTTIPTAYLVVQADLFTGIVLGPDGKPCRNGNVYAIPAESLNAARVIAKVLVEENPRLECSIRDDRGHHIEFVRNHVSPPRHNSRTWWQRLFGKAQ
jgi:hypothetical protein